MNDVSGNLVDPYMRFGKPLKSKADRVKESITILKKLEELGIPSTEPGYQQTKMKLDQWIQGGNQWSGRIDFPRFGRRAELVLPIRPDRIISMKLFAPNT